MFLLFEDPLVAIMNASMLATYHWLQVDVRGPGGVSGTYYFEDWLKAGPVNLLFPKVGQGCHTKSPLVPNGFSYPGCPPDRAS
jgi:hypothetical protein